MTERKKPGVTFESFVDKQIREAQEQGAFDNLSGAGKPIPRSTGPNDELWWIKGHLQRENLSTDALLPEALQLRKEIERLPIAITELRFEDSVREMVTALNARIVAWIRMPSPPLIPLAPVDVEHWVELWRQHREAAREALRERRTRFTDAVRPEPQPRSVRGRWARWVARWRRDQASSSSSSFS